MTVPLNSNPGFEVDTAGWQIFDASLARSTAEAYRGVASALVVPDGGGGDTLLATTAASHPPVNPGELYNLSAFVYIPDAVGGTQNVRVRIGWLDAADVNLGATDGPFTQVQVGEWTEVSVVGSAFASATRAIIGVAQSGVGSNDELHVDEVVFSTLCVTGAAYEVKIDWNKSGSYLDAYDDVTGHLLAREPISLQYGRDQARALAPGVAGELDFELCNLDRLYSPENVVSPIFGDILPGRNVICEATWLGVTTTLIEARIDDYDVKGDRKDRSVAVACLDSFARFQKQKISTSLFQSIRTGDAMHRVLDAIGWPVGKRDIDVGATIISFWWENETDAGTAFEKIVASEGPPSIAYLQGGVFTFKDRHHRIQDARSQTNQAEYCIAGYVGDCETESPCPTGSFKFTEPFEYEHGMKNIVNSVTFSVDERRIDPERSVVWESEQVSMYTLGASEVDTIEVETNDPFTGALVPVEGTDFELVSGSVSVSLSRTSGQSTIITLTAGGGGARLRELQLRAYAVPVKSTVQVSASDAASITDYDVSSWPDDAPWVNRHDAKALAQIILLHYANRLPQVTVRIVNHDRDPGYITEMLTRMISDRVGIQHPQLQLDADFYVENVKHTITRLGKIHETVLGCEQVPAGVPDASTLFTFDVAGRGFDDGRFGT